MATTTTKLTEPSILTANTFYWTPSSNSGGRMRSQEVKVETVAMYLDALGFEVKAQGTTCTGTREFNGKQVEVTFEYYESCKNVYKSLEVYNGGKKSNITLIRKIHAHVEAN